MSSRAMTALLVLLALRSAEANVPDESCLLQTSAETLRRSEAAGSLDHAAFTTKTEPLGAADEICKEGECIELEQADELLQKHWNGTSLKDDEALLQKHKLLDEETQDVLAELREVGCCGKKSKGHGIHLDAPFMTADPKRGWRFAPQIKVGIRCPGLFHVHAGVDIVNGFQGSAGAALETSCSFCGNNIVELFSKWPDCPALKGEFWRTKWEFFKTMFESGHFTTIDEQIAKDVQHGITANNVANMRQGHEMIKLKISAHIGVGAGTEFGFGWANMKGYHMFGGGGSLDLGLDESFTLMVGLHESGVGIKIIVQLSNLGFELTFLQRWWDPNSGPNPLQAIKSPTSIFQGWR